MNLKFSVLLSIYSGAVPDELNRALESVWDRQTHRPSEIMLVIDGPIPDSLQEVVRRKKKEIGDAFRLEVLSINQGLGAALQKGVSKCSFDWIARMDADDWSHNDRFDKQLSVIKSCPDVDIVGTYVQEVAIQGESEITGKIRSCPTEHDDIVEFAKKRCPFNHPSVMFRKATIIRAGNYSNYRNYQDYELWVRAIQAGAKCLNIAEPMVFMKMDRALISRRGGWAYARLEYSIQRKFLSTGFLTRWEFVRNILIRGSLRLLPSSLRHVIYLRWLR